MIHALLSALAAVAAAAEPIPEQLAAVPIKQVTIEDEFWSGKRKIWQEVTIVDCFKKFENDRGGALNNFDRVRDGKTAAHAGPPWYDGLIYEMIRGSADFLAANPDTGLETRLDGYIARIAAAQGKDLHGYLNTWTELMAPDTRWGLHGGNDIEQHDVYNFGALVEAGVHYYQATGKTSLLEVAVRMANGACDVIGPVPKANVIPGHALPEEALAKLYLLFRAEPELKKKLPLAVDEARYLRLAEFFIENRGNHQGRRNYGAYDQDHEPVLRQRTLEGHAVRATLLGAGLTQLAAVNRRDEYVNAAERLWSNMTGRRMYVNGGVGSSRAGEAFASDFNLPNDGYLETCAAVGSGFFSRNLNLLLADARYVDELERTLYNAVLAGVSLEGDHYFYENPLEAGPGRRRWAWHDCPCCPPMFLKIMGAMPGYIYAQDTTGIYVNLFVGSRAEVQLPSTKVAIKLTTHYPWEGTVRLDISPDNACEFDLSIRIPGWCQRSSSGDDLYQLVGRPTTGAARLKVNGQSVEPLETVRGYAKIRRRWQSGDTVELALDMPIRRVKANAKVEAAVDRVALMRGPLVYCVEGVDNPQGIRNLVVDSKVQLDTEYRQDLLGGVMLVRGVATATYRGKENKKEAKPINLVAVPYYANCNRRATEMLVWLAETASRAEPRPAPTIASLARPSASHCWQNDTVTALNDQIEPTASDDTKIPRFTWWDHKGTTEWVQYDFDGVQKVSAVEVYWWDERRINAHCRVPRSWRVLFKDGELWKPVENPSDYGIEMDKYNRVTFKSVATKSLRIEAQLQPNWCSGILEWRVE